MRAQFLSGELLYTLKEVQILTERWRIHYNMVRPHSSLGGQPPAPETLRPVAVQVNIHPGPNEPGQVRGRSGGRSEIHSLGRWPNKWGRSGMSISMG